MTVTLPPLPATVVTDASYCPQTSIGAWAAWIRYRGELYQHAAVFKTKPTGSYQAEKWAAANGILIALKLSSKVLLRTDCMAVVEGLTPGTLRNEIAAFKNKRFVLETGHVKAHTSKTGNVNYAQYWCDLTARGLMRQQRDIELNGK